jgi:hypothetical protein
LHQQFVFFVYLWLYFLHTFTISFLYIVVSILHHTSFTIPNRVTEIGEWAFTSNKLTSVTIPNRVTQIGEWAFALNNLTNVTIPNSVTEIGELVFLGNQLTSVNIPNSVTYIGEGAFSGCANLTTINVADGNNVYIIENDILYSKDKTSLHTYPAGKTDISFTIPDSVISIMFGAFSGCTNLTSVTIPNSVISIGDYAFQSNHLNNVTIGANVQIENESFSPGFEDAYNNNGKRAGTYTRPDTTSDIWTRRDVDQLLPVTTSNVKTYIATSNLRLRSEPDTSTDNRIASISEGDNVELVEVGRTDTLDGITAPWFRVKAKDGTIGWAFSGYLSER